MRIQPITFHRFLTSLLLYKILFISLSSISIKFQNFQVQTFSPSRIAVSLLHLMAGPASATLARKSARTAVAKDSAKNPPPEAPAAQANKATAPKKARVHPPYYEMIKEAIMALKERTGSSQYAIAKFIEENQNDLPPNFKKLLLVQLKKFVASGKLTKVKNSFKLSAVPKPTSDETEKPKKELTKKVTAGEKTAAATTGKPKKAAAVTKDASKKKVTVKGGEEKGKKRKAVAAAPKVKKAPVKKPKSIKSPNKKLKK